MFRALLLVIKLGLFALSVLVLGNWIKWDGITISDQVRIRVSQAEHTRVGSQIREWAHGADLAAAVPGRRKPSPDRDEVSETHSATERQKLKNLIRELNGP